MCTPFSRRRRVPGERAYPERTHGVDAEKPVHRCAPRAVATPAVTAEEVVCRVHERAPHHRQASGVVVETSTAPHGQAFDLRRFPFPHADDRRGHDVAVPTGAGPASIIRHVGAVADHDDLRAKAVEAERQQGPRRVIGVILRSQGG
jgi:hypothetical protein